MLLRSLVRLTAGSGKPGDADLVAADHALTSIRRLERNGQTGRNLPEDRRWREAGQIANVAGKVGLIRIPGVVRGPRQSHLSLPTANRQEALEAQDPVQGFRPIAECVVATSTQGPVAQRQPVEQTRNTGGLGGALKRPEHEAYLRCRGVDRSSDSGQRLLHPHQPIRRRFSAVESVGQRRSAGTPQFAQLNAASDELGHRQPEPAEGGAGLKPHTGDNCPALQRLRHGRQVRPGDHQPSIGPQQIDATVGHDHDRALLPARDSMVPCATKMPRQSRRRSILPVHAGHASEIRRLAFLRHSPVSRSPAASRGHEERSAPVILRRKQPVAEPAGEAERVVGRPHF